MEHYAWGSCGSGDSAADYEVKIWIGKDDGTYERMSENLVARLDVPDPVAIGYLPKLRIECWAIELRLRYFAEGIPFVPDHHLDPKYFAAFRKETNCIPIRKGDVHEGMVYWPFVSSAEIKEGDKLHAELCEQTAICIKMHDERGLVFRKRGGKGLGILKPIPGIAGRKKRNTC